MVLVVVDHASHLLVVVLVHIVPMLPRLLHLQGGRHVLDGGQGGVPLTSLLSYHEGEERTRRADRIICCSYLISSKPT